LTLLLCGCNYVTSIERVHVNQTTPFLREHKNISVYSSAPLVSTMIDLSLSRLVSSKYEWDKDVSRFKVLCPEFFLVFGVLLRCPNYHLDRGHHRE